MSENESFRYKHYLRVIERLNDNNIIPKFTFNNYKGVKIHYDLKCGKCGFEFVSSFDNGITPKCPKCLPNRLTTNYGHPENIDIKCEHCSNIFNIIWKKRTQRFCSVLCKNEFIKKNKHEMVKCLTCGELFERYKNIIHPRSGKLTQYCSNECSQKSTEKKNKLRMWIKNNNPMNESSSIEKIGQTKFQRYGDETYNNMPKQIKTMIDRYGVKCMFNHPSCKSNGKRVSKFQRREYIKIFGKYPDAILEKYLVDVHKAVDIYIPSIKKVIECHGDYWHCNPSKCMPNYYNKIVHLTAQEIWDKDRKKLELLKMAGYDVEVIWENTSKLFKHSSK